MVCYGLLWYLKGTQYGPHKANLPWSNPEGPRRTSLKGSSSADTHRANFRRASSQVSQPRKHMRFRSNNVKQEPNKYLWCAWLHGRFMASCGFGYQCHPSRMQRKSPHYESVWNQILPYCPGLLTRNQQGLRLKMWASWFNMHVIHRHTLDTGQKHTRCSRCSSSSLDLSVLACHAKTFNISRSCIQKGCSHSPQVTVLICIPSWSSWN